MCIWERGAIYFRRNNVYEKKPKSPCYLQQIINMHMQQIIHLSFDQYIVAHSEYQLEAVASKVKEKKLEEGRKTTS